MARSNLLLLFLYVESLCIYICTTLLFFVKFLHHNRSTLVEYSCSIGRGPHTTIHTIWMVWIGRAATYGGQLQLFCLQLLHIIVGPTQLYHSSVWWDTGTICIGAARGRPKIHVEQVKHLTFVNIDPVWVLMMQYFGMAIVVDGGALQMWWAVLPVFITASLRGHQDCLMLTAWLLTRGQQYLYLCLCLVL